MLAHQFAALQTPLKKLPRIRYSPVIPEINIIFQDHLYGVFPLLSATPKSARRGTTRSSRRRIKKALELFLGSVNSLRPTDTATLSRYC
jgi:hypothetical protein